MEKKFTEILFAICRINTLLKSLSTQLDKLYESLTDEEMLNMFDLEISNILSIEDYE